MHSIKLSTVYQLVLTALVLGACFGALMQGRLWAVGGVDAAALASPTTVAVEVASNNFKQANVITNPIATNQIPASSITDDSLLGSRVQVQVQVQATGNAKAEGSAKGPGDTNVSANTNGPGNALASALSNLPDASKVLPTASAIIPSQVQGSTPSSATQLVPQAIVNDGIINLRRGPGTFYDVAGTATRGQVFQMLARTDDYHWWQVCCFNNEQVWVNDQVVYVNGPINLLQVVASPRLPPTPTASLPQFVATPMPTLPPPTLAPPVLPTALASTNYNFDLISQEQFEETIVPRIYLYVYSGAEGLEGYALRVKKDGVELPVNITSFGGQPGMTWPLSIPRQRFYNMKLEYKGTPAAGTWELQLLDAAGKIVGPPATFYLSGDDQNKEMYIRYQKR